MLLRLPPLARGAALPRRAPRRALAVAARVGGGDAAAAPPPPPPAAPRRETRLLPFVLSAPARVEAYFARSPPRRALWCAISGAGGFYAGNVTTLSFGALAINDVLAAVLTLLFYEAVSRAFYAAERRTLRLWFAQWFKLGLVAALLVDALKLG
jgi:hypothetical protein